MEKVNRLLELLQSPSKEMLDAGMSAAEDCKDSSWDSGGDGESFSSYEFYTSDAPAQIFKAMVLEMFQHLQTEKEPTEPERIADV